MGGSTVQLVGYTTFLAWWRSRVYAYTHYCRCGGVIMVLSSEVLTTLRSGAGPTLGNNARCVVGGGDADGHDRNLSPLHLVQVTLDHVCQLQ